MKKKNIKYPNKTKIEVAQDLPSHPDSLLLEAETAYLLTNKGLEREAARLKNSSDDEFVSRNDLKW